MDLPPDTAFTDMGFAVHHWNSSQIGHVTVLQREPFRLSWAATKVVTFVFLIGSRLAAYSEIDEHYPHLIEFAKDHKRTILPRGLQCGYALLPIYIAESFDVMLQDRIRTDFKKRWCIFHVPSLFETDAGNTVTLRHESFWGVMYREYVRTTILDVTNAVAGASSA
jgi:hypothetical protein